jgi:serine/threonine-protein kinase HipA
MKRAKVYLFDYMAGTLTEDESGFLFVYDRDFLTSDHAQAISLTLPLTSEAYRSTVLFPFFDGLIPEGWLLGIAEHSWKINQRDRMSLLLACCKDCIGAVSVMPDDDE